MGDTLRWEPREEDNEWNNQCEYLRQGGASLGCVWYSLREYGEEEPDCAYKKDQWYYASTEDAEAQEAGSQEEAKALCIMLCKLNQ